VADGGTVSWTGYGSAAYAQLGAAVAGVKHGDPLAPVTVLVPTNICGIVARRRLAEGVGGRPGVAGLSVLTVDRLAERLAAPALIGRGRRPTTDAVLAAAWRQTLARDHGVFAPVAGHPATVRALVLAHRELRDVDDAALTAIAAGGGPVAADLIRLHRTVNARLADRHYDVADLRREAMGGLRRRPDLAEDIGRVVVFLPQDLRLGAVALLADILATTGGQVIAGRTGDPRADAAVLRTVQRLLPDAVAPADPVSAPTAATVMHASDADDEVRCVVRRVVTALRTTPAHRIAVLYGSARPYARLLAEQFAAAGLARNGAGISPTLERTLTRLLLDLLALPAHGWRRDEVLSLIARATVRTADGRRLPAARWERTSREAGVVTGADWEVRLGGWAAQRRAEIGPDTDEDRRRAKERDAETADELRLFVAGLRAELDEGARLTTWPELARWGATAFARIAGDLTTARLPEDEVRAAEKIHRTLAGLAGLGALEETADLDALRGTLELELGDDLPRHGTFGRGVLVAPLSESIGLDVDTVIVVGLADDLVPGRLDPDALLPAEVRALAGGQLPPPREQVDRQHRQLLAALAAGPAPIVSFPRGDLRRSTNRLPSRWLLPTLRLHSGLSTLDASGWPRVAADFLVGSASFAAGLAGATELATEQEWRTRAAAAGVALVPDEPALARAVELLRGRRSDRLTRFDGDLTGLGVPDPVADAAPIAPTTLELWTRCPHAYFVERLLGIRPVDPPEQIIRASGMHIGSIVHVTLDRFHQRNGSLPPGQDWTPEHRAQLYAIAEQVAAEFTALGLTGHPLLWREDFIGVLAGLDHLLTQDDAVRAGAGRRQVRAELDFGRDGRPPVELTLPGGRTLLLKGSADRVDQAGESIVVVDYKTGSTRSFKDLREEDPTARGSKLQLPVYAYAARAALGAPTAPVSAEYWFVGTHDDRIGVPLTPDVERIFARTVDVIVGAIAAGLFPHRPPAEDGYGYIPCQYCDPDGLGAGEHRRRWLSKRDDPRLDAYRQLIEPDGAAA
jgi:ATP-dependent helicase/nuclease subunit B